MFHPHIWKLLTCVSHADIQAVSSNKQLLPIAIHLVLNHNVISRINILHHCHNLSAWHWSLHYPRDRKWHESSLLCELFHVFHRLQTAVDAVRLSLQRVSFLPRSTLHWKSFPCVRLPVFDYEIQIEDKHAYRFHGKKKTRTFLQVMMLMMCYCHPLELCHWPDPFHRSKENHHHHSIQLLVDGWYVSDPRLMSVLVVHDLTSWFLLNTCHDWCNLDNVWYDDFLPVYKLWSLFDAFAIWNHHKLRLWHNKRRIRVQWYTKCHYTPSEKKWDVVKACFCCSSIVCCFLLFLGGMGGIKWMGKEKGCVKGGREKGGKLGIASRFMSPSNQNKLTWP